MKLSENIDKIVWSALDKGLYVLYGFIVLLQIRRLEPSEYGLYGILIGIHTWIFIIADSLFLQSIIQFGYREETERRANTFAFLFSSLFVIIFTICFSLLSDFWVKFFNEVGLKKVAFYLPFLSVLTIPRVFCLKFAFKHSNMFKLFVVNAAFFITMSFLTILFYFKKPVFSFETLMEIYFTGTIFSSLIAIVVLRKYIRFGFRGNLKVREFFYFGLPMMSYSLFQSIPRQLDVLFLQYFFESKIVGLYYSAKTLFRLFEEGLNAGYGLVYPTAVRLIAKERKDELFSLIVKSTSFTFLFLLVIFIILEFGGSDFFIKLFLPERYLLSISFFNFMLIATIFMPLQLSASVMIAENKVRKVAEYIFISSIASVVVFVIVGLTNIIHLAPLGLVSYYTIFGLFLYFKMRNEYKFRFKHLFQGIKDLSSFFQEKFRKK